MIDAELFNFLKDLTKNTIIALIIAIAGAFAKTGYDFIRQRWILRHMSNIFGDIKALEGRMLMVLPVFNPLSEDNFHGGKLSRLQKSVISNEKGTRFESWSVPLFSDVLVIDDFKAYRQVERLFTQYCYGFIEFCSDVDALQYWSQALILCFGGPRSNQKLRQIMHLPGCDFIDVDDAGDLLSDWVLRYQVGDEHGACRASEEDAYSYIFKTDNPNYKHGKLMGIAGDSAVSTFMAAQYLRENVKLLSKEFKRKNFFVILHADRSNFDSVTLEKTFILP